MDDNKQVINFNDVNEITYWSKKWEISPGQLFSAWLQTRSNEITVLQYWAMPEKAAVFSYKKDRMTKLRIIALLTSYPVLLRLRPFDPPYNSEPIPRCLYRDLISPRHHSYFFVPIYFLSSSPM